MPRACRTACAAMALSSSPLPPLNLPSPGAAAEPRACSGREMVMSRWRAIVVVVTALIAMPIAARAQDYPTRNVTILVPFAPGGGTDVLARAYARILENKYGKSFVIENRPGGGTTLAATVTANAKPDGYTLMQGTSGTMTMNPTIFQHLSYEPLKTVVPVSLVAGVPFVLTVNPALPVHSVAELIALAKKR